MRIDLTCRRPQQLNLSACRPQETEQNLHRRGLTRTVMPEEPKNLALPHPQGDIGQHGGCLLPWPHWREGFCEMFNDDGVHVRSRSTRTTHLETY
jgi:hypothetical protein